MSGGGGSNSTPTTPNSTTLPAPISPIVSFLPQPAAGSGLRYPLYATVQQLQGSPLIYSPTMFGMPWRPLGTSGQGTTTNTSSSSVQSTVVNVPNLSSLSQIPTGLVYPIGLPMLQASGKQRAGSPQDRKKTTDISDSVKRRSDLSHLESDSKRRKLSESIPHSPSLTSSSPTSHPSTPTHPHKSSQPTLQRSPVIKFIPYNQAQPMVLPTNNANPRSSVPQAIVLPAASIQSVSHQSLPKATVPDASPIQQPYKQKQHYRPQYTAVQNHSGGRLGDGSSSTSNDSNVRAKLSPQVTTQLIPPTLPDTLHISLLKCFGHLPDSVLNHPNITISSQLQDLYRQSYYATSTFDPLSPESACSLTICYLNSLRQGETINVENLRTMMHYSQLGEAEWIQYYKKHKKMSESTYVQSQLMHLSRMSVYPTQGKVQVRTSHQSLGDGLILALYNLLYIANNRQNMPEYIVVMAVHPSATIDFCVLVIEPFQVLRLRETKLMISLDSKKRKQQTKLQAAITNCHFPNKLTISKEILAEVQKFHKSLDGNVQVPFFCPNLLRDLDPLQNLGSIPISKARLLIPTSSHVIEHKPSGPFQDQCNVAMFVLQKILSCFTSETKIEQFKNVDFRVLCPPEASFVSQTVSEVVNSGLVNYLQLSSTNGSASNHDAGTKTDLSSEAEVERRIVCCNLRADFPRFQTLLKDLQDNKDTLFLIVVENAHLTTKIANRSFPSSSKLTDATSLPISDCLELLKHVTNCVFLNVSSHPYSLQSNHSLMAPATNQVHWPERQTSTNEERPSVQFCSSTTFQTRPLTSKEELTDFGVRFREDSCFEERYHEAAAKLNQSSVVSMSASSLRAQLLLEQYILSLLATVGQSLPPSCGSPQPETLALVGRVVQPPLLNLRGHGSMLIIRCHDVATGQQFYQKLKATRDSLGLQFRFEIILDDGTHFATLSDYFAKRITCPPGQKVQSHVTSYKELEGIPCIVVLAGFLRSGLTFPRSLCGVDLRLCSPVGPLTRQCYEYDTSLLNGHYSTLGRGADTESSTHKDTVEAMDTTCIEDTDSVFEIANSTSSTLSQSTVRHTPLHPQPNGPVRTSSSSSSRKSSYCEDTKQHSSKHPSNRGEAVVISWHPTGAARASIGSASSSQSVTDSQTGQSNEVTSPIDNDLPDCNFDTNGTVTVTIDPPKDEQFYTPESVTETHLDGSRIPFTELPADDCENLFGESEELESDSEEEGEDETKDVGKVCLLSRQYYHVWSSQNKQQHLLLPPAPGISWCGGHRRPPLFDSDPQGQSLHYYKWSKPSSSHDRMYLDSVSKETGRGAARRFLLSGPPQVGKTGAWLLLIRLLHDHLRSSQGVIVETTPLPNSIFLQDNTPPDRTTSKHTNSKHSKIVTLDYLTSYLCNGIDSTEDLKPPVVTIPHDGMLQPQMIADSSSRQSESVSTISISTSPYMAYDFAHSCNDCAQYKLSPVNTSIHSSEILTSELPSKTASPITIKWHIPPSQVKHCVSIERNGVLQLERLKLPTLSQVTDKSSTVMTPVFIPTVGRDVTGLFNLFHSDYHQLQVLVTVESQLERYCKAWPYLIVMALPDHEAMGLGSTYHMIKCFAQHNFQLNVQHETASHTVWPMMAIMSDNIVMWKRTVDKDQRNEDISMSEALLTLENTTDCLQYAALSVQPWSEDLRDSSANINLTDYDLSHDFIMLNLSQTADISYNQFSFNSSDIGFNLKLRAAGLKTKLRKDIAIVRKHLTSGGNLYPLHSHISSLSTDLNKVVISLHHDSSCHLPHPGPYLMEHYLLHKSQTLFPHAREPGSPVLVVGNYVTLGPQIHVTMVNSESLAQNSEFLSSSKKTLKKSRRSDEAKVRFGGLLLYLCEGKLKSEQLNKLNFVSGACLCLVTRDCKTLVQEVARLDLEEKWKFRLRDEYQTACSDKMKPLFFLIGRYED